MELWTVFLLIFFSQVILATRKDFLSRLAANLTNLILGLWIFIEGIKTNFDILLRQLTNEIILIQPLSREAFLIFIILVFVSAGQLFVKR